MNRNFKLQFSRNPLLRSSSRIVKHRAPPSPCQLPAQRFAAVLHPWNPGSSRSRMIKPVSGCAFVHLSNLAQTRNAPPVIIYSTRRSGMRTGDSICFDNFRSSSDSVASRLQSPCRWRPDPLTPGCGVGGSGHQSGERTTNCSVRFRIRSVDVETTILHGSSSALLRR